MPTVYKTAADRGKRNTRWMIAWTDEHGRRRTRRAYSDKLLSERLARQLEDGARARREGTIDAVAERMVIHARRPIDEHIVEYRRYLEAKGNTASHIDLTIGRIEKAVADAGWTTTADVDAATLSLHIDQLRAKNRGPSTINHYLRAVKGFTRWLVTNHRLAHDPLIGVKMLNTATDLRRERRALDDDELAALLQVARKNEAVTVEKRYIRKSGPNKGKLRLGTRTFQIPNRDLLYLLAASTGLRFGEIKSLTPRSFNLNADSPTVTVEASYSKRRRRDEQPLRHDIAEAMRPLIDGTPRNDPLWPKLPDEMAKVMAEDLKAADIPVRDEAGRVIDFHALRHTFITRLARSGVTPKVAQALARHSTITLTLDRYAHMALADTSKALAILPAIPTGDTADGPEDEAKQVAATGTDGPAVATSQAENPCPTGANEGGELADPCGLRLAEFGQNGETKSQRRSQRAETTQGQSASSGANTAVSKVNPSASRPTSRKPRNGRGLERSWHPVSLKKPSRARGLSSEADGTRTRNHRIDSPVL
jgi:integrase/recombinase XerD